MKFMKLGFKPDTFQSDGNSIRYVVSDLASDVTVNVADVKFHLHKFPLLSKSGWMQKQVHKSNQEESEDEINILDFPGGPKSFEICAKFCYGMTVTLNAYNVVAVRCAAEFLEMTETIERSNLIGKIEVFLNSSVFRSWKDSIIVLQTTRSLSKWSENLKIIGRGIDAIASKTSVDPEFITWSYTYNRKLSGTDGIVEVTEKSDSVPVDWWVEDICDLEIDLFKRVIVGVKSKGRMNNAIISEALRIYAVRWIPDSINALISENQIQKSKSIAETIILLLPGRRHGGCSCSFLLKLLKVAILVGVDEHLKEDLIQRVSLRLHEASVSDLLIHDLELVRRIVNQYLKNEKFVEGDCNGDEKGIRMKEFVLGNGSLLNAAGSLIDGYLAGISCDLNLEVSCFVDLAEMIPDEAREVHDGLYRAIDTYLKEHPNMTKAEKKKICGLMNVKKLTSEASMHAAQNDRLPLRVIVQVLYFEQIKTNPKIQNRDEEEEKEERGEEEEDVLAKKLTKKCVGSKSVRNNGSQLLLRSRSRRIFDRIWGGVAGKFEMSNKSSEISSGSSQSPTTSLAPGDTKSSGSSSRHRRYSIS